MIWTIAFWKGLGERAIKTFLQSFIGALVSLIGLSFTKVGDVIPVSSLSDIAVAALTAAGVATLGSISMSLGNANFTAGQDNDPTPADPLDVELGGNVPQRADDGAQEEGVPVNP